MPTTSTFTRTIGTTTSFTLGTGMMNDGAAIPSTGYGVNGIANGVDRGSVGTYYRQFMIFRNITIPQNRIIYSANLNIGICIGGSYTGTTVDVILDKNKSQGAPSHYSQVFSPISTTKKRFYWRTGTGGANTITGLQNVGTFSDKTKYDVKSHNIQPQVQALVDADDYSNDNMAIYLEGKVRSASGGWLYMRDFGSTKAPELVINYGIPPVLTDKTTYRFV